MCSFSQVPSAMPPEATTFYDKAMKNIKPEIRTLIETNASQLRNDNLDSLKNELKKKPGLSGFNSRDIDIISVLIMVKASQNADSNLKQLVLSSKNSFDSNLTNQTNHILDYKSDIAKSVSFLIEKMIPFDDRALNNLK
jgi:hypothetical protein